jgi:hypothetical protein
VVGAILWGQRSGNWWSGGIGDGEKPRRRESKTAGDHGTAADDPAHAERSR